MRVARVLNSHDRIEDDNGPLQQYRSSFAYTDYSYVGVDDYRPGSSAKERVSEFPITGTF